jgi:drug/metabolite transporter (DMT)-like permease
MGVMVKSLGGKFDSFEIAFFRSLTALIFMMPFMFHQAGSAFRTSRPVFHILRGVLGSTGMMCGFYALVHLPLATANAISFSRAIFLVPLAMLFVGEVVGPRRLTAALVGFAGVLIILRPSAEMEFAALVAVFGALTVAGAVICVKLLSRTDGPKTLLFYSSVIGVVVTAVPAALAWATPSPAELLSLCAMGAFGVLAQACFIRAYSIGEVGSLAPFDYARLLFAAIAGYFLFGNLPDLWTWVGAAVIVGSTLYITMREVRVAAERNASKLEASEQGLGSSPSDVFVEISPSLRQNTKPEDGPKIN